ncbi:MAG: AAA family ATPase [Polyangiaceae bacterium]
MSDSPIRTCSFCSARFTGARPFFADRAVRGATLTDVTGVCGACVESFAAELKRSRGWSARASLYTSGVARVSSELESRVIGLSVARRALTAALFEHWMSPPDGGRGSGSLDATLGSTARRLLFVGPSGAGKTLLLRSAADLSAGPALVLDAGRLSEAGAPGESVETLVGSLVRFANGDATLASRGALFVDGVELAPTRRSEAIQRELLRLLDGGVCDTMLETRGAQASRVHVDVGTMLVAVGARAALPAALDDDAATRAALLERGVSAAFLARFDRILALPPLDEAAIQRLLRRKLADRSRALRGGGLVDAELELPDDALAALAHGIAQEPDGGFAVERGVQRLVERAILERADTRSDR